MANTWDLKVEIKVVKLKVTVIRWVNTDCSQSVAPTSARAKTPASALILEHWCPTENAKGWAGRCFLSPVSKRQVNIPSFCRSDSKDGKLKRLFTGILQAQKIREACLLDRVQSHWDASSVNCVGNNYLLLRSPSHFPKKPQTLGLKFYIAHPIETHMKE